MPYSVLKHSFSIPRLLYLLRCSPCWKSIESLAKYDDILKSTIGVITNCNLNSNSWLQSSLPIKLGGLGIRDASTLSVSAFLGSVCDTSDLIKTILPAYILSANDSDFKDCLNQWASLCKQTVSNIELPKK